jgi:hypothetical protein
VPRWISTNAAVAGIKAPVGDPASAPSKLITPASTLIFPAAEVKRALILDNESLATGEEEARNWEVGEREW